MALLIGAAVGQSLDDLRLPPAGSWPQHGRTPDAQRFSPLDQVHIDNVAQLRLAWARELGHDGPAQGNPAVWDGTLYVATSSGVVALDGVDGAVIWEYDGASANGGGPPVLSPRAPRGSPVVYDGTVFATLREPVVVALDAADGSERWRTEVGTAGLAEGFSSGPVFAHGRIIVGPTGSDYGGAPGRIVALDAATGTLVWTFDVVPTDERDPAFATWQPVAPSWATGVGGASAWNVGAYDVETHAVVYGTGQPSPWHRGDHRRSNDGPPSADLYSSSFVALDVDDGSLRWYHQVVPGDEWEYDQHTVPVIVDADVSGRERRVAILATTTGFIVLQDMHDGSFIAGHEVFEGTNVHVGYEPDGAPIVDDAMRSLDERAATSVCPGMRWAHVAPAAYSPLTGLLYRPNDTVCVQKGLRPPLGGDGVGPVEAFWLTAEPRRPDDYFQRWGALSAIDPRTGHTAWEFTTPYPHDAGVLATAGHLVFSAFADRTFRAFDARTGDVVWEQVLTAHGEGSPITYAIDGVQYVAVLVGHPRGVAPLPASGLPPSVAGRPTLFVFALGSH